MTLAVQTVRQLFNCNGSTDTFAIPFAFSSSDEVEVVLVDTDTDVETVQVIVTDYTISGTNVVTTSAHASDKKLLIRMDKDLEQQTADFSDQSPFPPTVVEASDDYQASLAQQLNERINRCLTFPKSSTHSNVEIPRTLVAESVPMVNAGGTAFEWITRDSLVGETGATGNTGPAGSQGIQGETGPAGEIGPAGPQGDPGDPGLDYTADAELNAIAGLTSAADKLPYFTGSGTAALADFTAAGRTLAAAADAAAQRAALDLEPGTDVQAYSSTLASLASASANGVSLATAADYAAMKGLLDLEIGTDVQAYDAQLSSLIRQNSQSAAYTTVLADGGKHILHPAADNNARTFTIDSNANVAYPIGTAITFVNQINTVTIAITSDTMTLAGPGTTGSRTLAANGMATAIKIGTTEWMISGSGLT